MRPYLHYVFDLWAEQWRRRHARGHVIIVRYADDLVLGFEYEADARRFQEELRSVAQVRRFLLRRVPARRAGDACRHGQTHAACETVSGRGAR
jgi:hypothetical protein